MKTEVMSVSKFLKILTFLNYPKTHACHGFLADMRLSIRIFVKFLKKY